MSDVEYERGRHIEIMFTSCYKLEHESLSPAFAEPYLRSAPAILNEEFNGQSLYKYLII